MFSLFFSLACRNARSKRNSSGGESAGSSAMYSGRLRENSLPATTRKVRQADAADGFPALGFAKDC